MIKQISGYNTRIGAPGNKLIDSEIPSFYSCTQSASAALVLSMSRQGSIDGGVVAGESVDVSPSPKTTDSVDAILGYTTHVPEKHEEEVEKEEGYETPEQKEVGDEESNSGGLFGFLGGGHKKKRSKPAEKKTGPAPVTEKPANKEPGIFDKIQKTMEDFQDKMFKDDDENV